MPLQDVYYQYSYFTPLRQKKLGCETRNHGPPPRGKALPLQDVYYQYSYFTPLRQPDLRAANVSSGGPCGRIAAADSRARAMLSFGGVAYVKGL